MNDIKEQLSRIGVKILSLSRNELYISMRFLDIALARLDYVMNLSTKTIGTDGQSILYNPRYLMDTYTVDRVYVNRAYMHMLIHNLFCHDFSGRGKNKENWNLACDIAAESIVDSMDAAAVFVTVSDYREYVYSRLKKEMKVLNAQSIYHYLENTFISQREFDRMCRAFKVDDHSFWDHEDENRQDPRQEENYQAWQQISEKMQTNMETLSKDYGDAAGDLLARLKLEHRERYDYRDFLKRFAVWGEEIVPDDDSFDYIFYTYGLQRYENMPLIEPLEYKEVKKTEEFVIVIDTSESCPPEAVKAFLEEACSALTDSETFFRKVNIHILQCDVQVVSDVRLTSKEEVEKYMADVTIQGGGGTDFRPAFAYIDGLIQQGEFQNLKGMVYLTDGIGQYPAAPPAYDVAFAMLDDQAEEAKVPSWAIRLDLDSDELREAFAHSRAAEDDSDNKHLEDI